MRKPWIARFRRQDELAEWLPWQMALDDERETIMTSSGGLLRVARIEAPDLETASPEALVALHERLGAAFARPGTGFSVWLDQWRVAAPGYLPKGDFGGCLAARLVDDSRERQFTDAARPVFSNSAFIALHYVPQPRDAVLAFLMERDGPLVDANVSHFRETSEAIFLEVGRVMRTLTLLRGDDLSSYLFANVTFRPGPASFPTGLLAPQLACAEWHTSPSLSIDGRHVATVEVRSFGSPSPLTCEGLHEVPFECRWVTAFHALDPDARRKEVGEVRKRWATKQKGVGAILTEIVTRNPFAGRVDPEAERAVQQLDALQGELADRPFALAHMNVHVWDERARRRRPARGAARGAPERAGAGDARGDAEQHLRAARRHAGQRVRGGDEPAPAAGRAGRGHALLAGDRGQPGHAHGLALRRPGAADGDDAARRAAVLRAQRARLGPRAPAHRRLHRVGQEHAAFPDGRAVPALSRAPRSPCSTAAARPWSRASRWAATGSSSGPAASGVQPLRAIDRPEEMTWAHEWVMLALRMRGLATTPQTDEAVSRALAHLADEPPDRRTLSRLYAFLAASDDARSTLRHYLAGQGPYGELFDGVVGSYGDAAVIGVETRDIIQLKDAAPLAVTAMFRAIQRDRLTGDAPKLVMVDEAWSLLGDEHFAGTLASWAREMRKLKAVLVLATQSLADLQREETQVISDQIGNSIYLPQPEATRPETRRLYEMAGLTSEQIELLAAASPKGEYLLQTEELTRLVSLRLEGDALRLCGASSPGDIARAKAMLDEGVRPGEEFTRLWLERTTAEWLAERGVPEPARGGVGWRPFPTRPPTSSGACSRATTGAAASAAGRAATATCGGTPSRGGRRRAGQLLGHVPGLHRGVGGEGRRPGPVHRPRPRPGRRLGAAPARGRERADGHDPARLRRVRRVRRLGGGAHAARRGLADGHDRHGAAAAHVPGADRPRAAGPVAGPGGAPGGGARGIEREWTR